jgi:hypothetical protein
MTTSMLHRKTASHVCSTPSIRWTSLAHRSSRATNASSCARPTARMSSPRNSQPHLLRRTRMHSQFQLPPPSTALRSRGTRAQATKALGPRHVIVREPRAMCAHSLVLRPRPRQTAPSRWTEARCGLRARAQREGSHAGIRTRHADGALRMRPVARKDARTSTSPLPALASSRIRGRTRRTSHTKATSFLSRCLLTHSPRKSAMCESVSVTCARYIVLTAAP